ncbi:hypothetical protein CY35_14G088300 [Sphagnum magellanicum]|nr:hypothetical protein CY35_14G088300 [Sphagnum magellanicum]
MVILVFYIDDMFLIGDDTKQVFWLEKELKIKFDMMSLGVKKTSFFYEHIMGHHIFHEFCFTIHEKTLVEATKEAIWTKQLYKDLNFAKLGPMDIYYDNQSMIRISYNLVYHSKRKHFEIH